MTVQPTPQNEPTPDPKEALSARVALPEYQENLAWPELKPLDEKPPVPAFPWAEFEALLPDVALATKWVCWKEQIPPEIAVLSFLACIGFLAQSKVKVNNDGKTGNNVGEYYCVVAPPHTGKSSADCFINPIYQAEAEAQKIHQSQVNRVKKELSLVEADIRAKGELAELITERDKLEKSCVS